MKILVYDTNGNDWGEYNESMVDGVEIHMGATIEGLANEQGIRITTHGEPKITRGEDVNWGTVNLVIRKVS